MGTQVVTAVQTKYHRAEMIAGAFLASYHNPNTVESYRYDLHLWFRWLKEMAPGACPVTEVQRPLVDLYVRNLESLGRAPSTICRGLSAISQFYEYAIDEEIIGRNPTRSVKRPYVHDESSAVWLTRPEAADWLNAAKRIGGVPYAAACLLLLNGLRVGEVCGANVEGLKEVEYHRVLRILGKGEKPADVPLAPRTMFAIASVVGERRTGPLLLNQYGNRCTRPNIARIVTRLCSEANIQKNLNPHGLRHTAITALLQKGVPLRDVQAFARHKKPDTTSLYDRGSQTLDDHSTYSLASWIGGAG